MNCPTAVYYFLSVCFHRGAGFSPKSHLKILQFVRFSISFLTAKPHYLKLYNLSSLGNVGSRRKIQTENELSFTLGKMGIHL